MCSHKNTTILSESSGSGPISVAHHTLYQPRTITTHKHWPCFTLIAFHGGKGTISALSTIFLQPISAIEWSFESTYVHPRSSMLLIFEHVHTLLYETLLVHDLYSVPVRPSLAEGRSLGLTVRTTLRKQSMPHIYF
jgi:hypothetical protein